MRQDMFKVIVERPRGGGRHAKGRFDADAPDEDSPTREALHKYRRSKWLNENLSPLERYLHGQVGRPWDRVYAEICERIDRRSTVQQHIHQHLRDFVAVDVRVMAGVLVADASWGRPQPLSTYWAPALYVDPRSHLLRVNKWREATRRAPKPTANDPDRRVLDATTELQRIGGVWYEVGFETLPPGAKAPMPPRFAVLPAAANHRCSGAVRVACAKRQLGRAELRRLGLEQGETR
jgi:hypothetical protein